MHILAYCNHLLVLPQFEFLHEKGFCILLLESVIQHNWCLCYNGILALGAHCSRDVAIPSLRFLAVHEREDVCSAFFCGSHPRCLFGAHDYLTTKCRRVFREYRDLKLTSSRHFACIWHTCILCMHLAITKSGCDLRLTIIGRWDEWPRSMIAQ